MLFSENTRDKTLVGDFFTRKGLIFYYRTPRKQIKQTSAKYNLDRIQPVSKQRTLMSKACGSDVTSHHEIRPSSQSQRPQKQRNRLASLYEI